VQHQAGSVACFPAMPLLNLGPPIISIFYSLIFSQHIRDIEDPEHPYTLKSFNVAIEDSVEISDELSPVR
jgi:hypothetical protein